MKNTNVLVLCTFPFANASHGGQVRLENLVRMFKNHGAKVLVAGVLGGDHYDQSPGFVDYPGSQLLTKYIPNPFLMEDWAIGRLFDDSDRHISALRYLIDTVPDIIHVELPWLMRFALRLRDEKGWNCPVIYGSENVEHELKRRILNHYVSMRASELCADLVFEMEVEAIKSADAVVCVSNSDLSFCKSHTDLPIILAENGVDEVRPAASDIAEGHRFTNAHKYCLYTASAHPPNVVGFFEMFPSGLTSLKPYERLVIAGSVGASILEHEKAKHMPRLGAGSIVTDIVTSSCLRGLNHNAHAIVLPITEGSGTNLKTAEALWAGVHIVATTKAMRGFESFIGTPGVIVCDKPLEFQLALRKVMDLPRLVLSQSELKQREAVLWRNTLKDYSDYVSGLVSSR
jgi:glycosyltransferase involved in cell wall biosynthesis